jgi:DNA-binding CsgD family transcriptional regulator
VPGELRARTLVGRDEELAAATAALAALARDEGGLLLVTGEAGVGKSRLVREVTTYAEQAGVAVLAGRSGPGAGPLRPLGEALLGRWRGRPFPQAESLRPFRPALARLLPGWADPDAGGATTSDSVPVLAEGVLELLASDDGHERWLLVLEDIHWADGETVDVLGHLAAAVPHLPVLVLTTARSDEPGGQPLTALRRADGVREVDLGRLPGDLADQVAIDCVHGAALPPEVLRFLAERADGLPLLVEEVLTGLVESGALRAGGSAWELTGDLVAHVPAGLRQLVAARLDGLAPEERTVLDAAAVAGHLVDWRLLAAATGRAEQEVLAALRAGLDANLLTSAAPGPAGSALQWRHDLTRQAVLDLLLPPDRERLAGLHADALSGGAGESGERVDLQRVAALRVEAGQPAVAAGILLRLADGAADRGELASAEDLLDRAGALAPSAQVTVRQVTVLTLTGRAAQALAVGTAALPATSGEEHAELCLESARAAVAAARWAEAVALVERSGRAGDPRADAIRADALFGAGDVSGAQALAATVVESDSAPAATRCEAMEVLGRCVRVSDAEGAAAWFRRGAQVAAEHGLVTARVRALHSLATAELARTGTSAALLEARSVAEGAGMLATVVQVDVILADVSMTTAGPREALAAGARAVGLSARLGLADLHATASVLTAWLHALDGDAAAARARLDGAAEDIARVPDVAALAAMVPGVRALTAGDLVAARDHLDAGIAVLARNPAGAPLVAWGLWVLVRAVVDDRPDEARDAFATSHASIRIDNRAAALYGRAVTAGRAGDADAAVALMAEADAMLAAQHWWRRLMRLLTWQAAVTDGWGDPVTGLRGDLAGFEADGAEALARVARDLLRQTGVTVRRGRSATAVPPQLRAVGVTAREAEVLGLVVQGLTNSEVAARLFLSPRTVDHHVARLLAKTGAANRSELRGMAPTG